MSISLFRPWLRRLALLLAVPVLLLALAWVALPWWVQGQGMRLASQALGRELTVGPVRFQPWRLALVLQDLRVAGAQAADPPLLEIGRIDAALSLRSLWHRSLVLESLSVQHPVLRLTRLAEGRYDIDDLLQRWRQAAAEPAAEGDGPPALALYNIRLGEGQVLLDDRPLGRRHVLSELRLELPFVSLLQADVAVHVEPHLSGRLNGAAFGSQAELLPFARTREARLGFKLEALDLASYQAYWPRALPLVPQRGRLSAELNLDFLQAPSAPPELRLSGRLGLQDVALDRGADKSWLSWQDLSLSLKDVQPLKKQLLLGELVWTAPRLALQRDAQGRLQLPLPPAAPGAAASAAPSVQAQGWRFGLDQLELRQAAIAWRDAGPRPAVELALSDVGLRLAGLSWPLQRKAQLDFSAQLQGGAGKAAAARLSGRGELDAQALQLEAQWQDLALEWLSPYVQAELPLALQGRFSGSAKARLAEPLAAAPAARLRLEFGGLRLAQLRAQHLLPGGQRQELARWAELSLDEARLEPGTRRLGLGRLALREPQLELRRAADGRLELQDLLPAPTATARPAAAEPPWALQLEELAVDQGRLRWSDAGVQALADARADTGAAPQPAAYALVAEQLRLRLQHLATGRAARAPVQLSLLVGRADARSRRGAAGLGRLQWRGELALAPLSARGSLQAERLPLQALDPYLDPGLQLHLRRAEMGLRADFAFNQTPTGPQAQLRGDLLLADLRLSQTREQEGQRRIGEELLSWQALNLNGLRLALQPRAAPQLEVTEASLSDFYARLIIDERGHFNLRDLGPAPRTAEAAAPAAPPVAASAPPPLDLTIGTTRLLNGSVDFSDRFVRPNYSARLSDLQGSLGRFASGQPETAPLSLRGRVAGTGLLDITGELNPGVSPPVLDIRAQASDIELAPLSPYAGKYAGYAIERGKLSTRVHYRIAPGGALQAENQLILNQLTFGERIDSPDATKLPVLLAVALLKDRNGVIDVDLPISGSLNDPQFSVGGLIFRLIVNLLGKALTSPFSLLAGGSGQDLSQAEFAPGLARLEPAADAGLDRLARALQERPGLQLTLTGWADATAERAAIQAAAVEQSLQAERRREQRRRQLARGDAAAEPAAAALDEAERQRLLKQVYQNSSSLPNRPRNLIGLLKDLPAAEMQARLAAAVAVDEEGVRQLALQRAVAVRDALLARGVPNERLFLAAPKLHEAEEGKTWTPRVEMALQLP